MNALFEGDLIRPLGLVTLYFGYAEFEVDALLQVLNGVGSVTRPPRNAPLRQKLLAAGEQLSRLPVPQASQLISIIHSARPLIDLRNALIHSCILAKGRVVPHDKSQPELSISPEQLNELAEAIWNWKERLNVARQLHLMPALLNATSHVT